MADARCVLCSYSFEANSRTPTNHPVSDPSENSERKRPSGSLRLRPSHRATWVVGSLHLEPRGHALQVLRVPSTVSGRAFEEFGVECPQLPQLLEVPSGLLLEGIHSSAQLVKVALVPK